MVLDGGHATGDRSSSGVQGQSVAPMRNGEDKDRSPVERVQR